MVRYRMVGRDANSFPTQYRTWVVTDYPDFAGAFYTGLKSGSSPFLDVSAYEILDPSAVVDFNLPDPIQWEPVLSTLPKSVYNSQLAIIDGYAYLFGGESTDKIYKADCASPADWVDTGAVLPTVLSGSQLAIVDDRVYLFGGRVQETVDTIFSAPLSDPLDWTNHGSLLPEKIHKSQLAIIDGYLWMFGGQDLNVANAGIWKASVSNPLSWVDTGASLPDKLYGSQIAILNGQVHLLGGLFAEDTPTRNIYSADLNNPLYFAFSGVLPYACAYGQFLTIGNQGYLYTQAAVTGPQPYLTRIFRCETYDAAHWVDMVRILPCDLTQSQFALVDDRIFSFGANGMSAIFASKQRMKFAPDYAKAVAYGAKTRTALQATPDKLEWNTILGFPYWKTTYES